MKCAVVHRLFTKKCFSLLESVHFYYHSSFRCYYLLRSCVWSHRLKTNLKTKLDPVFNFTIFRHIQTVRTFLLPVPVAARSKAWIYDSSPAEIMGSSTAGGTVVCFLWMLFSLSGRGLCDRLVNLTEKSTEPVCGSNWVTSGLGLPGLSSHDKKKYL